MVENSVVFIPGNAPQYQALKSDMTSASTIPNISYIGADVWFSDTNEWYRVTASMVLKPIYTSASPLASVAVTSVGSVTGCVVTVDPAPVVDINFQGQIYVSSSTVAYSGSNLNVPNRNGFIFKNHPSSAGKICFYAKGVGSTSGSAGGMFLDPGDNMIFSGSNLGMLDYITVGATTACLCWIKK